MSTFKQIKTSNHWICDDGRTLLNTNYKGAGKTVPVKYFYQDGYKRLTIEGRHWFMSNLVAEAFLQKIEGKDQVDHINGVRDDDRVENLRYCTAKENCNFEPRLEHMHNRTWNFSAEAKESMSLKAHKRFQDGEIGLFNEKGEFIKKYPTVKIAAEKNNVDIKTVRNHINGRVSYSKKGKYFKIIEYDKC